MKRLLVIFLILIIISFGFTSCSLQTIENEKEEQFEESPDIPLEGKDRKKESIYV
ncbi:unnamed protein product, partial [marine sediment metagenome]